MIFQPHNQKFYICLLLHGLAAGCSTKETIDNFFCNQFKLNLENTICIDFQCHVAKLSQYKCFIQSVYYTRLCTECFTKEETDSFFRGAP